MALADLIPYCTQADVEDILSPDGVKLRLDDDRDENVSVVEQRRMTKSIARASEEVNKYCFQKYTAANLATSNWVNQATALLAACYLCRARGNQIPESLEEERDEIKEELEAIRAGQLRLPGVPLRRRLAPKLSQVRVSAHFQYKAIRKERNKVSPDTDGLPQQPDYREQLTPEL